MVLKIKKILYKLLYIVSPIKASHLIGVKIGDNCRLLGKVSFGTEPYLVRLGDNVSITESSFVTHDGSVWLFRKEFPNIDLVAPIHVGNNVFIGMGCIILPGVTIGDNVIVGAGSVVTKDLDAGFIYAGVPARRINSVSEYKRKILPRSVSTKNMSFRDKKSFLLSRYIS